MAAYQHGSDAFWPWPWKPSAPVDAVVSWDYVRLDDIAESAGQGITCVYSVDGFVAAIRSSTAAGLIVYTLAGNSTLQGASVVCPASDFELGGSDCRNAWLSRIMIFRCIHYGCGCFASITAAAAALLVLMA